MISKDELKFKQSEELHELRRQLTERDKILNSYKKEHGQLEVFFLPYSYRLRLLSPSL